MVAIVSVDKHMVNTDKMRVAPPVTQTVEAPCISNAVEHGGTLSMMSEVLFKIIFLTCAIRITIALVAILLIGIYLCNIFMYTTYIHGDMYTCIPNK